ncbi:MAG TPA: efflux transporter outer membrane subunit [Thermoanaerobaculia bacterium]|nr:efflux transporter outer membrane subunit [Thermoanaerobaculia bacterium]
MTSLRPSASGSRFGLRAVRYAVFSLAFATLTVGLTGCASLKAKYARPAVTLPAAYSQGGTATAIPDAWWKLFGDPNLDRLVDEALGANQDLAAAAARVEEARALAGFARAEQFPEIDASGASSRTRFSNASGQFPPGVPLEFDSFRLTASVSYEFDFWGRYRRATEAARAELLATDEGRKNVRLALAADVATAWFDLLSLDRQLAIARETLGTRGESVRIQKARYDAGTISELDLAQAQSEVASTEATIPSLQRSIRQTENRLNVLLGRIGGTIDRPGSTLETPTLPEVPVGLPSQLLARRPDVVAAEQRLIAADARIGIARAAYFPSISLTGYAGSESTDLADLFGSGTGIWQAALGVLQPIWNAGRTRRQVEAASAREKQAEAAYQKSIQTAFAEVEDALVARSTGIEEREARARQVEALGRARNLADIRYDAGESSYFEVLDAQRTQFLAQITWTQVRRDELVAAVALFKALGGGWEEPVEPVEAAPTP